MTYDEWFDQFKQAHHAWNNGQLDATAAAAEITRLRTLVPTVDADQDTAEANLQEFEQEISPAAQDRMSRAVQAHGRADTGQGTVQERIARLEAGIAEITAIAEESGNPGERMAILGLNEDLAMLIEALETS